MSRVAAEHGAEPPRAPSTRVLLLGLTVLAAVQLALAVAAFVASTRGEAGRFRLPLPERVAAIVALLEATPPARVEVALRALSADDFAIALRPGLPDEEAREDYPVEAVASAVTRYVEALGGRRVEAWIAPDEGSAGHALTFEATRLWSNAPLRLAVAIEGPERPLEGPERWLLIETRDRLAERVFGFPPGLWAGVSGVLVAMLSLLVLWRGLGPLAPLAERLDAFAARPEPSNVPERGVREVRRVTRAANALQARVAAMLAERRAMSAALGHDLRTYLTRLSLRVEAIPDPASRALARRDLDEMEAMVDGATAFAEIDEPMDAARLAPLDVPALVAEVAGEADVPSEAPTVPLRVRGDRVLLKRAIANLLANAERHGGGGTLRVAREGRTVAIDVLDRGPGLPPGEAERLMRPFERGDRARTLDVPGSGLGLAIVERIAALHGGTFALDAREGGGLRARLTLPLAP